MHAHVVLVQVSVVESHSVAGGAAHTWRRGPYHFESGPSLYSGMNGERWMQLVAMQSPCASKLTGALCARACTRQQQQQQHMQTSMTHATLH